MKKQMFICLLSMVLGSMAYGYEYSDYTWYTYNGHQYAVTMEYSNWVDAEAEAVELGGHLVTINDADENTWLTNNFGGYYTYEYRDTHFTWESLIWIGLEHMGGDMADPTSWQWVSGEPKTYMAPWWASPVGAAGVHAYLHTCTHPNPGTWWNSDHDIDPDDHPRGIIELSEPPCEPIIYVDKDATGTNDGSSWTNAFNSLQNALAVATSGDEIWVAEGNYKPAGPGGSRSATFQMENGVALYGGFTGSETSLDQRNPETHESILSGDLNGNDGADFANNDENSYHVVTCSGNNATAVLDGFTIKRGNANGSYPNDNGGGVLGHSTGAKIVNCKITQNAAKKWGGGVYTRFTSTLVVTDCIIVANSAGAAGGIGYDMGGNGAISNNVITDNFATQYAGAIGVDWYSSPTIFNNLMTDNYAGLDGGAIWLDEACSAQITNNTFSGNCAGQYGGAICCRQTTIAPAVRNCVLWGNSAGLGGSQIALQNRYSNPAKLIVQCSDIEGSSGQIYKEAGCTLTWGTGNINRNPLFAAGGWGDFYLSHLAAGQAIDSPCIDAGGDLAAWLGLDIYTTRTDQIEDCGTVDMGYHYPTQLPGQPEWFFVHMTDPHIGALGAEDKFADIMTHINNMEPTPDFVLNTGDVVENAWIEIEIGVPPISLLVEAGNYKRYLEALKSCPKVKDKVYTVPGNHDRYVYHFPFFYFYSGNLSEYDQYITLPADVCDLGTPRDYTFERNGIVFIGLDSGKDEAAEGDPILEPGKYFRGKGLTDNQVLQLEDPTKVDPSKQKIIFMHHPAIHVPEDEWVIGDNRANFLNYCRENNVQLVLTGHTHQDNVFDRYEERVESLPVPPEKHPLFIQTPSASKTNLISHSDDPVGYRIIDVIDGKAYPRDYTKWQSLVDKIFRKIAQLFSCASLHVYDSQGKHTGIDAFGEAERAIPGSFYFSHGVDLGDGHEPLPEKIIVYNGDDYLYEVVGTERGTYILEISSFDAGREIVFEANDIPTLPDAVHQYLIDWELLAQGGGGVTLFVDRDGDGEYERAITSDSILTGDEFDAPCVVQVIVPGVDQALQDGVTLTAEAHDEDGVDALYFYLREPNDGNGVPIGYEELPATLNGVTGQWELPFDTTLLPDGYYVILAKAVDTYGNVGWSEVVPFSIRNWAVVELLPASKQYRAGRTMPVKFSLRIAEAFDPAMPFVYNEQLEIRIYKVGRRNNTLMQTSTYGDTSTDYRISTEEELYITNFKTDKRPAEYLVEIWRLSKNFLIDSFTFETARK